jgi:hypothetical protein
MGWPFPYDRKDNSTFKGVVNDFLSSQPNNLPSSIINGKTEVVQVLDIERLTFGD